MDYRPGDLGSLKHAFEELIAQARQPGVRPMVAERAEELADVIDSSIRMGSSLSDRMFFYETAVMELDQLLSDPFERPKRF